MQISLQEKEKFIREREAFFERENMPYELRSCRLEINENLAFCVSPVPLHGRVDQAFLNPSGKLLIVDTKKRSHIEIYKSDIIQLSAYRVILSNCRIRNEFKRYDVLSYGYVRLVVGDLVQYHRIDFLSQDEVINLWLNYQRVHFGFRKPVCTCGGFFHKK
jgi:hypothetical protein